MHDTKPTIHILGAGGIGCALGYALSVAGGSVTLVDVNDRKIDDGLRHGIRVDDRPARRVMFTPFADWRAPANAILLLCTKCYDNSAVLAKLPGDAMLVPVQNGFDPQLDQHGHTFEGIASFVSECEANRPWTRITRPGDLHLGPRVSQPGESPRFEALVAAISRSDLFRVKRVKEIEPFKFAKLMYNAAISPIAAIAGLDNGKLLSLPVARRLFFDLIQENYRILASHGLRLGKVGPFRPATVAWILRQRWLARTMAKAFEPSLRGTYCSMAGEIMKGRTEIDNYNGHLIRLAERANVPCPMNRVLYDLVTGMTRERIEPHQDVLRELSSATYREPSAVTSNRRRFSSTG